MVLFLQTLGAMDLCKGGTIFKVTERKARAFLPLVENVTESQKFP